MNRPKKMNGKMIMILSEADAKLFFELWLVLLDHANKKYKVNPQLSKISPKVNLPIKQIMKVSDWLWEHPDVIDSYLLENSHLSTELQEIVRGWKRFVRGSFIVERHLRKGSVFISSQTLKVYLVKGITDPWDSLLRHDPLPIMLHATLIPFRDTIISDGLVRPYDVMFGGGMKQELKDIYINAKKNGEIIQSL